MSRTAAILGLVPDSAPALTETSSASVPDSILSPAYEPLKAVGTVWSRVGWFFLFSIPLAVVVTAATLSPDPAGHSTHTQLGLPPCGFLVLTGIPCPGCGLTTAFSNMVRLDVVAAAMANPFGIPLFLVTFFTIPFALVGFVKKAPLIDTLEQFHAEKVAVALAACGVLVWVIRFTTCLV